MAGLQRSETLGPVGECGDEPIVPIKFHFGLAQLGRYLTGPFNSHSRTAVEMMITPKEE